MAEGCQGQSLASWVVLRPCRSKTGSDKGGATPVSNCERLGQPRMHLAESNDAADKSIDPSSRKKRAPQDDRGDRERERRAEARLFHGTSHDRQDHRLWALNIPGLRKRRGRPGHPPGLSGPPGGQPDSRLQLFETHLATFRPSSVDFLLYPG